MADLSKTDEELLRDVCKNLFRDGLISPSELEVYVQKGVVTLEGKVSDKKAKKFATECLDAIYGIQDVVNNLKLKDDRGLVGGMNWPL